MEFFAQLSEIQPNLHHWAVPFYNSSANPPRKAANSSAIAELGTEKKKERSSKVLDRRRRRKKITDSFSGSSHKINKTESKFKRFWRFWPKSPIKTQVALKLHLLRVLRALTNSNRCKSMKFRSVSFKNVETLTKNVKNRKELQDSQRNQTEVNPRSFVSKETQGKNRSLKLWKNFRIYTVFIFTWRFGSGFMSRTNRWSS